MIDHSLTTGIDATTDQVWGYVGDMSNWAAAMPGYREFEVIDEMNSRWTLKVGVAAMVRTVNVLVRIDRWEGPDLVEFTYRLDNDPVEGVGTYKARALADGGTEIALKVTINGQGPMAPAWEAMATPLLPKLAKGFAEKLKDSIEAIAKGNDAPVVDPRSNAATSIWQRLRGVWQRFRDRSRSKKPVA
ncbi:MULTISPECIES: SRPBCC family protein [unclassified Mycobacterium]|uniref:CoxG family protein n=1 Tax=unclassified Mycobacterium TaxID=2642494 RepID=UPI0029C9A36D|nr:MULTISPECIES: SRPBCC family protein [unclassified Mycobacterium]